ncbi:hypothetical protein B0T14DRAFT_601155 [Immersiella caudata]|uniref:BZIP domain-containing protein n=1 Tax=Immersiella caudata TaxID=314043 RepID=A0AA39WVH9_9PEZI|nr:hypothetical protein B0T14DRAFT_601155 [Immersiella caudata]
MSVNVFRFFRPPGEEKEDRSEKRRAQVRRAQQTYRLRKDQYARALEREVARLRSVEATLSGENKRLLGIVHAQQCRLAEKRVWGNIWDGLSSEEDLFQDPDQLSPSSSGYTPFPSAGVALLSHQTNHSRGLQSRADYAPPTTFLPQINNFDGTTGQSLGPSDLTSAGMEFVLALESPCLSHIHAHTDDPTADTQPQQPSHQTKKNNDPDEPRVNGHALTASSYVLALPRPSPSPAFPSVSTSPIATATPPPFPSDDPAAATNKVALLMGLSSTPSTILDRLLKLSTSFALEDEMTPVQAWARVRTLMVGSEESQTEGETTLSQGRGRAGEGSREVVQMVMGRLAGLVKCYGFGAVVKRDAFEQVLSEVAGQRVGW